MIAPMARLLRGPATRANRGIPTPATPGPIAMRANPDGVSGTKALKGPLPRAAA